ncbi:17877_t:CDS:2, partial [Gigaspora rosea]
MAQNERNNDNIYLIDPNLDNQQPNLQPPVRLLEEEEEDACKVQKEADSKINCDDKLQYDFEDNEIEEGPPILLETFRPAPNLGKTNLVTHSIYTGEAVPIKQKAYQISPKEK